MPSPRSLLGRRPGVGQELVDLRGRVTVDPEQHVREVGDRVDAIQLAGSDEGVEPCQVLACLEVTDEEEGFSAERNTPQRGLGAVVVWRDARVAQEDAELAPVVQ